MQRESDSSTDEQGWMLVIVNENACDMLDVSRVDPRTTNSPSLILLRASAVISTERRLCLMSISTPPPPRSPC